MANPDRDEGDRPQEGASAREEKLSLLLVPVWIGLFMGLWAGIERLLALAPRAGAALPALRGGAQALADARGAIAPILGFLLGTYAIVVLGEVRRRARGEPSPCEEQEGREEPAPRSGVPEALRAASELAGIERELHRVVRAERNVLRRAALAVNNRIMLGALRRHRPAPPIGCSGIVLLLLGATAVLPFAAEALGRVAGFELGPLAVPLWFALAWGSFGVHGLWYRSLGRR